MLVVTLAILFVQEDIEAAGKVVETTRDPMFRDPKTHEYLG